jgi:hypothetical protein
VYITAAFIASAWIASLMADTFIARRVSDNWYGPTTTSTAQKRYPLTRAGY